ncbi:MULTISPECIES: CPBP family intramembrane glutamic endopeptidase [Allobranchiibius]|uniref:Membrane protease YdiL (CAAX protease family) n=1 Tax=Allobranchiibius huperziae TaxID=1874116 RepID=A0A853D6T6_9MICO|nr:MULTISPECIES: CPBP family intramembrane glutamic endopeptidase [Allobranchiibius]MBO1765530.1 CPBP family intramembrane metalloprotease [Allobranchiibius sp. GilTou38]NYJ73096.1 membrane protease YdiL (CAAX protease family) [Allobranchiibius huperziae]
MTSERRGARATIAALWRGPLQVPATPYPPRTLVTETAYLLLLSLGASAIYSILSIIKSLQSTVSLGHQTSTLNASQAQQSWLDLAYQVVGIGLGVVPALLAIHLIGREIRSGRAYFGLDRTRLPSDLGLGALLAACIGIPGLVLYVVARDLGANTTVVASALGEHWWTVPVLIASAIQNAVLEEVVMVGYLFTRWTQAGGRLWVVVVGSALIRGSYHLYQGFGGFVGNIVMGLILGTVYLRTRRVLPLIITHSILDIVSFVGYSLLHDHIGWLR